MLSFQISLLQPKEVVGLRKVRHVRRDTLAGLKSRGGEAEGALPHARGRRRGAGAVRFAGRRAPAELRSCPRK